MNTLIFVLLSLAAAVTCYTEAEYKSAFEDFKVSYDKKYLPSEEAHRYEVFKANFDFVNNWDAEAKGFKVKMNKFGDLNSQEFAHLYLGTRITKTYAKRASPLVNVDIPDTVDWRTAGAVTGVKDQGQCGSCWSFSTTGSVEGAWKISGKSLVSLSEQNLIDCSGPQGDQGCNGGLMDDAFQYIISNSGIDTEISYPYTASQGNCQFQASNVGATISSFTDVTSGDENALQTAVAQQPVSVAIDASQSSFQFYSSGVYYEPNCSSSSLDHGVLAIGYGTDNGTPYWLVKNSWGTSWGMNGFIEMSRNKNNNCGIATAASYPTI